MDDEEVRKWLDTTEGEDVGFDHALDDCRPGDADVYRRLAEARKVLARHEPHMNGTRCEECDTRLTEDHTSDCIFNKIPGVCRGCGVVARNMQSNWCETCQKSPS